ncbi:MAG TPA: DsbA family protein [Gemmatimonadales bacterium]|nr:DsbA family protein [Gemmatimonadales bacterium]
MPPARWLCLLALLLPARAQETDSISARTKGRSTAPVTVYEMADFQCPACRRFALTTLPLIDRDYIQTGKVRWVFVNFPLTQIHRNALAAAQVAMCAARQNKFWPIHDALYRAQPEWADLERPWPALIALADSVGVGHDALVKCLDTRATVDAIAQDAQGSRRAGANATPTFYIEGGLAESALPLTEFSRILDSVYRVKTGAPPPQRP